MENEAMRLWVERYRQHLELLNHSPRTWPTARGVLEKFGEFLMQIKRTEVTAITPEVLREYQRWLFYLPTWRGHNRSTSGQNRCLRMVRSFCRFLHDEGLLPRDPSQGLRYGREPQTLPRNVLTPQEARKIIEAADVQTILGYRDRTMMEVLYATAIRKSELQNLTPADVNLDEGLLRINGGKGAKDRVVPLTQVACSFLESYMKAIRPQLIGRQSCDRLFVSMRARSIAKNTLDHLMRKYARLGKVKKHLTCHLWRHSCATHLVQNKANLRHVQEMLGHKHLSTTERYLHLTIADLKEAHRKFHPRG
jgi:integrase/recombinase XerD